jgi:hypothetical protein
VASSSWVCPIGQFAVIMEANASEMQASFFKKTLHGDDTAGTLNIG